MDMSAFSRMLIAIPTGITMLIARMLPPAELVPFVQESWLATGSGCMKMRLCPLRRWSTLPERAVPQHEGT